MKELNMDDINEILALKEYSKAKRIAVENFLMTVHNNLNYSVAFANLRMDSRLYTWNAHTIKAIICGMIKAFYN